MRFGVAVPRPAVPCYRLPADASEPSASAPGTLVLALLAAFAFGLNGARSGWGTVSLYHEPINPAVAAQGFSDEADRAAIVSRVEAYLHALDAAKARGWPLGVATLLLGTAAMLVFALRAFAVEQRGTRGPRAAGPRSGRGQRPHARPHARRHRRGSASPRGELRGEHPRAEPRPEASRRDHAGTAEAMFRIATPLSLALHLLGSALVVFALTRPRARAFFDPAAAAVRER